MDDFDVFWLSGAQTQGVVMCNQPRTVDLLARQSQFIEALPNEVIDEVLAKLQAIYEMI